MALWQAKRRGAALPRWKDFDFADFTGWHRNLALSDLPPGKADPCFRIFGSGATELMGGDLTGKRLSEVVPDAEADGVLEHFAALRDERLIGYLVGNVVRPGHGHRVFMIIELPLENECGDVTQILHAFQAAGRTE